MPGAVPSAQLSGTSAYIGVSMKKFRYLIYPALVLIFIQIIFSISVFDNLEHKAQDSLFRLRGVQTITDSVVIVALDDETFNARLTSWPFPRADHAKLIENLTAAGARQIIFDIEFTEESDPENDLRLAEAGAAGNNTIFAGKLIRQPDNYEHVQFYPPIPAIQERGTVWGIVNMPQDKDAYIRSYGVFEPFDEAENFYPLGVASIANLRFYQSDWRDHIRVEGRQVKVAGKTIPLDKGNLALINYFGPARTFTTIPYSQVIDDSLTTMPGYQGAESDDYYELRNSGVFEGKIVLIGATIDEMHDKFLTPFGGELTPGVEIHANFIEMVLQGRYLHHLNHFLYLGIELLLLIGLWLLFKFLKPQFSALGLALLIVLQYTAAFLLFKSFGLLIPIVQTALAFLVIYGVSLVSHYLDTQKEKRFIRNAFQQYMAPQLVKELLEKPGSLTYGGSLQEITVLFSDIRSFTTYSENHKPEETVQILKEYLTEMVNTIIANQGIVDKFVGDEIMALYGTPVKLENHALAACKTAIMMRERLTALQQRWRSEGREDFDIGIGINTGTAVIGNLGSEQIFDYTAIGDTINLGARLEGINKEYQTTNKIIFSEFTLEKVQDLVEYRYLDEVKVKGKNKSVKIYELISVR